MCFVLSQSVLPFDCCNTIYTKHIPVCKKRVCIFLTEKYTPELCLSYIIMERKYKRNQEKFLFYTVNKIIAVIDFVN